VKIRNPFLIEALSLGVSLLIRVWMWSLRYQYVALGPRGEPGNDAKTIGDERILYAFWHENILVPAYRFRDEGITVMVSRHADGQLIARAIERLGFHTVRGSTTRGGAHAVRGMVTQGKSFHLAITPDGPKGPRRVCQQGVVAIASMGGRSVMTFGVGFARAKRLKSWDRFALPRPFSKVVLVTGDLIKVPNDLTPEDFEIYRSRIQAELDRVQSLSEELATGTSGKAFTNQVEVVSKAA
jgi:lysophospholipid acyltransferase (LPLAT)-like uncharacterized protein